MDNIVNRGKRFYYMGFILLLGFIIAAELIWLPAPIALSNGVTWIEMIDWLFYVLAVLPLCWLIGGGLRFAHYRTSWPLRTVRLLLCGLCLIEIGVIFINPGALALLLLLMLGIVLLLFTDLIGTEIRNRAGFPKRSSAAIIVIVACLGLLLYPTGYNVTYPAMTLNLNRYAHADGGDSGGSVNGVLVFERPSTLADRLYAQLFQQYRFTPIPKDEPPLTENYAQVVAMKTDANELAAAIAMEKAGIGQGVVPSGVQVLAIISGSPADGTLQAGDILIAMNEQSIRTIEDVTNYMTQFVLPGDIVQVEVQRGEEKLTIPITTTTSAEDDKRAVFGISIGTDLTLDIPRGITYKQYMAHIGGPSHGAMLTLAFIDQLTPGGVTKGLQVSGTGTIEADGSVGMVGGVPQKAYAVSRTDADVFFVPVEAEAAARAAAPKLQVVAVHSIDEILAWLQKQ